MLNEPTTTQTVLFADLVDRPLVAIVDQPYASSGGGGTVVQGGGSTCWPAGGAHRDGPRCIHPPLRAEPERHQAESVQDISTRLAAMFERDVQACPEHWLKWKDFRMEDAS